MYCVFSASESISLSAWVYDLGLSAHRQKENELMEEVASRSARSEVQDQDCKFKMLGTCLWAHHVKNENMSLGCAPWTCLGWPMSFHTRELFCLYLRHQTWYSITWGPIDVEAFWNFNHHSRIRSGSTLETIWKFNVELHMSKSKLTHTHTHKLSTRNIWIVYKFFYGLATGSMWTVESIHGLSTRSMCTIKSIYELPSRNMWTTRVCTYPYKSNSKHDQEAYARMHMRNSNHNLNIRAYCHCWPYVCKHTYMHAHICTHT